MSKITFKQFLAEKEAKSEKPLRSKDEPRPQRAIEPTEQRSKKAEAFWKKRNKP